MKTAEEILRGRDPLEFLTECRLNFRFFCERLLTRYPNLIIKDFHLEWVRAALTKKRVALFAPRQHGKTTILGVALPIYLCLFYKRKKIMIVSNKLDNAKRILEEIRLQILDNEILSQLKPSNFNVSWTKTELNTSTECKIFVSPYSENIRGHSLDYVILDEASEYRDPSIFYGAVLPTVSATNGTIIAIGTPKSELDLLNQLYRSWSKLSYRDHSYWVKKYRALVKDEETGKLRPLFPEKYSMLKLEQIKKEQGEGYFTREYLCELTAIEEQPIPPRVIVECYDENLSYQHSPDHPGEYYMGVDLAMSPKGDWTVITVLERVEDNLIIRHITRVKGMGYAEQEQMLYDIYQRWKPAAMLVDESSFGRVFVETLRTKGLPVEGYPFTPEKRNTILRELTKIFNSRSIKIPFSEDMETQSLSNRLSEELSKLDIDPERKTFITRGAHDDMVMSLALAVYAATRNFGELVMAVYPEEVEEYETAEDYFEIVKKRGTELGTGNTVW